MKHANVLPSNEDFKKLQPTQAYWYYSNLIEDNRLLEEAQKNSNGKSSVSFSASGTDKDFIDAVKRDVVRPKDK